jgi:solute carrier family 39 (zinc transporter), member 11
LGFSAGVMVAASFWSLLAPAIELAESSGHYGSDGKYAFIPVALGFLFGAIFVYGTDKVITYLGINSASMMIQLTQSNKDKANIAIDECTTHAMEYGKATIGALNEHSLTIGMDSFSDCLNNQHSGNGCTRKRNKKKKANDDQATYENDAEIDMQNRLTSWKRIILLITAVTIHNIPGMNLLENV